MYCIVGEEDEGCAVLCPFCGNVGELQHEDYVTAPMIWCDNCGARSVLKLPLDRGNVDFAGCERYEPSDLEIVAFRKLHHHNSCTFETTTKYYKVPVEKIAFVANCELLPYKAGEKIPSLTDIAKLIESDYSKDIVEELGLLECDDDEIGYSLYEPQHPLNLKVPCDSWNVVEPKVPYPKGFHTHHDGIEVGVELENGTVVYYWGD
jgi:hypothetical protein